MRKGGGEGRQEGEQTESGDLPARNLYLSIQFTRHPQNDDTQEKNLHYHLHRLARRGKAQGT